MEDFAVGFSRGSFDGMEWDILFSIVKNREKLNLNREEVEQVNYKKINDFSFRIIKWKKGCTSYDLYDSVGNYLITIGEDCGSYDNDLDSRKIIIGMIQEMKFY